jgi:hypothetical protein
MSRHGTLNKADLLVMMMKAALGRDNYVAMISVTFAIDL